MKSNARTTTMYKRWCLPVGLALIVSGTFGTAAAGGWSSYYTLDRVYPTNYGMIWFGFTASPADNPDSCNYATLYGLDTSTNGSASEIYSLVLAAAAAGKQVRFYLDGCTTGSFDYPKVIHADMDVSS